jgi:hypothetical protein
MCEFAQSRRPDGCLTSCFLGFLCSRPGFCLQRNILKLQHKHEFQLKFSFEVIKVKKAFLMFYETLLFGIEMVSKTKNQLLHLQMCRGEIILQSAAAEGDNFSKT